MQNSNPKIQIFPGLSQPVNRDTSTTGKYIASFNYFDKSLIVSSALSGSIAIALFPTFTGTSVWIASASFSLAFLISTGIIKKLLKTTQNKKKKQSKIVMLARSKLKSIENKTSEALKNNKINHKDFMAIINQERNYRELKEGIRMINSQRSDAEKVNLIEEGKKIGIDEVIKQN